MDKQNLEILINQLNRSEIQYLLNKFQKKITKTKPKVYVEFPITETTTFGIPRTCVSKKDAIRHLNEVVIQDCDKKPIPTIKAQVVDALSTIAEAVGSIEEKARILSIAAKFVMITERETLLRRLSTLATFC